MKSLCSRVLLFLLLAAPVLAQKTMNEARPDIRLLIAEKSAKYWADTDLDTAWVRAIRINGLLASVVIQKLDSLNTAAGTYRYTLHSSFWRIRSVWRGRGANRHPIIIVDDPRELAVLGTAAPSEYCFIHQGASGFELNVHPPPDGVDKIYYYYYGLPVIPTTAAAATDLPTPLLPSLLFEAASFLLYADYKFDFAQKLHERSEELVNAYRNLIVSQGNTEKPQK